MATCLHAERFDESRVDAGLAVAAIRGDRRGRPAEALGDPGDRGNEHRGVGRVARDHLVVEDDPIGCCRPPVPCTRTRPACRDVPWRSGGRRDRAATPPGSTRRGSHRTSRTRVWATIRSTSSAVRSNSAINASRLPAGLHADDGPGCDGRCRDHVARLGDGHLGDVGQLAGDRLAPLLWRRRCGGGARPRSSWARRRTERVRSRVVVRVARPRPFSCATSPPSSPPPWPAGRNRSGRRRWPAERSCPPAPGRA